MADRIRQAASKVDAFIDTFGADYVQLALELGVEPSRVDTIVNFGAVERYGIKAEGNTAGVSASVLAELAELIAGGSPAMIAAGRHQCPPMARLASLSNSIRCISQNTHANDLCCINRPLYRVSQQMRAEAVSLFLHIYSQPPEKDGGNRPRHPMRRSDSHISVLDAGGGKRVVADDMAILIGALQHADGGAGQQQCQGDVNTGNTPTNQGREPGACSRANAGSRRGTLPGLAGGNR